MKVKLKAVLSKILHKNRMRGIVKANTKKIVIVLNNNPYQKDGFKEKREKEYLAKWSVLYANLSPLYYRAYTALYNIPDINYVPHDIFYGIIEPILNNRLYSTCFEEKNLYDILFASSNLPNTIIRNIDGTFYDISYRPISVTDEFINNITSTDKLIVKPTTETGSGRMVKLFCKNGSKWQSKDGEKLSLSFLNSVYKHNFIMQEYISQSQYINKFNENSVNTLRIMTYRSVKDDDIYILSSSLRIGMRNSHLDNVHAGGVFCGIYDNGKLTDYAMNDQGFRFNEHNGIDFKNNDYYIPNYDCVKDFVLELALKCIHHRLLSFDVAIDENECPKLVEVNPLGQGLFVHQMVNGSLFGTFTDEVIAFCKESLPAFYSKYILSL